MATSGAIPGTTDHQYIAVEIGWAVNWSDSSTNRTSLYVELWARRTNTGYTTSGTFTGGLTVAGSSVGSTSKNVSITNAWIRLTSGSIEVAHNADGTLSVPISAWGGIPGAGWNTINAAGTAVLNRLLTIPPKPTAVIPVRNSDTQFTVGITHGTVGARNPIYSTQLQRKTVSTPVVDWFYLMNTAGAVTSYVDGSTVTNSAYVYRANAWNDAGDPGWLESATVYTTPGAPSSVTAAKNADLSITVNWVSGAAYVPANFEIRDNGTLVATVAGSTSAWTHVSPDAGVTHTYTVRAVQGSLGSAWVASNTIQLLTPPLAPSGLTPSGTNVLTGSVTLAWTHNPVDSSPQSAANVRYRIVGAGAWTTGATTTAQLLVRTLSVGSYEWQVQTKGAHASFGAWSALATFSVVAAPTVTITGPTSPLSSSVASAVWTWAQAQGLAQTAWVAVLETPGGAVIETRSGTGATSSTTFATRLADATDYVVRVTVSNGSLSATDTRAFSTVFVPPPAPILTVAWDETRGRAQLSVNKGAGSPATVSLDVERSVDGGLSWEPVALGLPAALASLSDPECLSAGTTLYRCTAWTATPSSSVTQATLTTTSQAMWINGGAGLQMSARLPFDPTLSVESGRQKNMIQYAGRSLPVPYSGAALSRSLGLSGTFLSGDLPPAEANQLDADLGTLTTISQIVDPVHLVRTPDGLRVYGQLSAVSVSRDPGHGVWSYSATLTETSKQ